MKFALPLTALFVGLVSGLPAQAAPFTAGDIVVERIGNGSGSLSSSATPVYLDEFNSAGSLVQTIALPTTGTPLTDSGSATSDGYLSRSTNGQVLVMPGYAATVGTASVASASGISREVAVVGANGTVQLSSLGTLLSGNNVRSSASVDGGGVYAAGANGIAYINTSTSSATMLTATSLNARNLAIADNQLYYSTGSGTTGIYSLGAGLPTSGTSTGSLIAASASPYAFMFADLSSSVAGVDTLYVADDTSSTGGIRKYSKAANGTWSLNNTLVLSGVRGLTGSVVGNSVQLFATSGTNLYSFTDSSGYNANLAGAATSLVSASTNTVFRGVALAPAVPEPASSGLALVSLALMGMLARKRA
ncbi:MAG: PEP-CTERM sorting domain-containing protein [Burkholderiales bacterium]|nr:MAG: PEP-CTERM sorting domain-containing protein [Burkholderiales bacterium]